MVRYRFPDPEQRANHILHLALGRPAVAGEHELDGRGGEFEDRNPAPGEQVE
jgi:hypothetical protein